MKSFRAKGKEADHLRFFFFLLNSTYPYVSLSCHLPWQTISYLPSPRIRRCTALAYRSLVEKKSVIVFILFPFRPCLRADRFLFVSVCLSAGGRSRISCPCRSWAGGRSSHKVNASGPSPSLLSERTAHQIGLDLVCLSTPGARQIIAVHVIAAVCEHPFIIIQQGGHRHVIHAHLGFVDHNLPRFLPGFCPPGRGVVG